jgi:hypothetical protein
MHACATTRRDTDGSLPFWILGAVFLYEVILFIFFAVGFQRRSGPEHPLTLAGEGMVIDGDGMGYYAWLRSLLIDGDWDFDNEFDEHDALGRGYEKERTPLGRRANHFSVGPACLWAPAVAVTHALRTHLPGPLQRWPADGFSLPYQLAVGVSALGVSAVALLLLFRICRMFARPLAAALATAFVILGTTQLNYRALEVSMAHGSAAAATALLVWYWLRTYGSLAPARWALVGGLVGVAALMRWQLALLAVLPAGECVLEVWQARADRSERRLPARAVRLGLAGLAAFALFLPQMVAWKVVYGQWLVSPLPLGHRWLRPDLGRVLLSTDRGLFYWTPLTLVLVLGCLLALVRGAGHQGRPSRPSLRQPLLLLLVAFAVQVYFFASVTGQGVYLGSAFGYRFLTEGIVLLAPGLAWLLETAPPRRRQALIAICFTLCVFNVLLMAQYHRGILPREAGADPSTLLTNLGRLALSWPIGLLVFLVGPAMQAICLWRAKPERDKQRPTQTVPLTRAA